MRITALATALVLAVACSANAVFVGFDVEGNNSPATANSLMVSNNDPGWNPGGCQFAAEVGLGSLTAGDQDWFTMTIPNGCIVTAITTPISGFASSPDTLMALLDPLGLAAGVNDDAGSDGNWSGGPGGAGPTRGSAVRYHNDSGGALQVWIGVSGWPDFGFSGDHQESGLYTLTVSMIPEPATIGLLLGGLVLFARRRK